MSCKPPKCCLQPTFIHTVSTIRVKGKGGQTSTADGYLADYAEGREATEGRLYRMA